MQTQFYSSPDTDGRLTAITTPRPLTLLEFAGRISTAVNSNPALNGVWVVAELSDLRVAGRHGYANLLEKNSTGATVATLRATIWSNYLVAISAKFLASTGRRLENGMKVMLRLSANHHPQYGLTANVTDIDPAYTMGDMERLRQEILRRLKADGVFDDNRSLSLSPAPQRIAVISAQGAAGYGDFMNHINSSRYRFFTQLFPAVMQGERTAPSILDALSAIEDSESDWDAVVIIRGGGASTDLNGFDNYDLAWRVAEFPIPVIVGIGHERDNTVLDYIANTRCKTPTAVAHFLIETLDAAMLHAEELASRIIDRGRLLLAEEERHLAYLSPLLTSLPVNILQRQHAHIDLLQANISRNSGSILSRAANNLTSLTGRISTAASSALARASQRLDAFPQRISIASDSAMHRESDRLNNFSRLIDVLSPTATLRRGYSITRVNGRAVRTIAEIPDDAIIVTTLADGDIESTISKN